MAKDEKDAKIAELEAEVAELSTRLVRLQRLEGSDADSLLLQNEALQLTIDSQAAELDELREPAAMAAQIGGLAKQLVGAPGVKLGNEIAVLLANTEDPKQFPTAAWLAGALEVKAPAPADS